MPQFDSMGAFRLNYLIDSDDGEVKVCSHDGCRDTTRNGKIYCTKHVESHVYVRELLESIDNRVLEDEHVNKNGSDVANLEGITAKELLLELKLKGPRTLERLERELQLKRSIVYKYAVAFKREGIVEFSTTSRGSVTVRLTDSSQELMIEE